MADIDALKKAYDDYKNDDGYNNIGKLNLVAFIGERSGVLFNEIEQLRAENEALKYELTKLQWQPTKQARTGNIVALCVVVAKNTADTIPLAS